MSVVSDTLALLTLQRDATAWHLLRAQTSPLAIAVLGRHLSGETSRLPVHELVSLVEDDLEELKERAPQLEFKRSAQAYCEQWRKDGYLIRKPAAEGRSETYELSGGALAAIAFATSLAKPHRAVTKSRLGMIIGQLNSLAIAADTDRSRKRAALIAERERIDAQIELIDRGEEEILDEKQALEQARDILSVAQEIPRDFANVSADFERISKSIYSQLIAYEEGYEDTLEDIFAGVDQIDLSPSGQSFRGFYELLRNAEATEGLQDNIDTVLDAAFSAQLEPSERRFLRRLIRMLLDQSREVNDGKTDLARGLRRFVQSRSFQQERALKRILDQALARASSITAFTRPGEGTQVELELSSTRIDPVSRLSFYRTGDSHAQPIEATAEQVAQPMTLEQLRSIVRTTEIDYAELISNVNAVYTQRAQASADAPSIADVLAAHPATQGAASVVGLILLAMQQGSCKGDERETVAWMSTSGVRKCSSIPLFRFTKEVS